MKLSQNGKTCKPSNTKEFCECNKNTTAIDMHGLGRDDITLGNIEINSLEGRIPECVKDYKKLKNLVLRDVNLTKIEHIDELNNLTYLDIETNDVSKIENLPKSLVLFYAPSNEIKKLENIDHLKNLERLDLFNNKISKMEGLENNINLKWLNIVNNKIERIENIGNLKNLEELELRSNRIRRIDGLKPILKHKKLKSITLEENPIIEFRKNKELNLSGMSWVTFRKEARTLLSELFQLKDGHFSYLTPSYT